MDQYNPEENLLELIDGINVFEYKENMKIKLTKDVWENVAPSLEDPYFRSKVFPSY